ncbi:uroporphyrinogen decarboxylase family protein [Treponema primitia]|uniref:uroporphyrinogen decarboxylase family protein n=1 Tax=Treponema primitia TaxID=88058 RepID=UPI003980C3D4
MTSKELIYNTVQLHPTDRQAVALLSGGSWVLNTHGLSQRDMLTTDSEKTASILFNTYTDIGSDIIWGAPGSGNLVVGALGGHLNFTSKGPSNVSEAPLKSLEDIEDIIKHVDLDVLKTNTALSKLRDITGLIVQKAGSNYVTGGTVWGPVTLAGLLFGVEKFMRGIYKNPGAVHRLLDWTADIFIAYAESYIENGIGFISMGEPNSSGDMISKKHFREFAFPALKKVFAALKLKNIITCLHICGNTEDRLDLIAETGVSLFSMDYKVNMTKARSALGGKIAFAGNVDPVAVMLNETQDGVEHACIQCINEATESGCNGFILMPGCDLPPATPVENVKKMMSMGRKN